MAKFINKKEQVYDIRLTAYGRYLISLGQFMPEYYAFYDDNILYDSNYAGFPEQQNKTEERILENTHYLESLVLFEDIDSMLDLEELVDLENLDLTPTKMKPRKDIFKFTEPIGDAHLDGENQVAPAWKIVALNGIISSSFHEDTRNDSKIPQINMFLNYKKVIIDYEIDPNDDRNTFEDPRDIFDVVNSTSIFADNKVVKLRTDNAMIYADEVNTDILNENFDIEVFKLDEVACKKAKAVIILVTKPDTSEIIREGDRITLSDGVDTRTYTWTATPTDPGELPLHTADGVQAHRSLQDLADVIRLGHDGHGLNFVVDALIPMGTDGGNLYIDDVPYPDHYGAMLVLSSNVCSATANTEIINVFQNNVDRFSATSFAGGVDPTDKLIKKYFQKEDAQVVDGFLVANEPKLNTVQNYTTSSVEYYFSVLVDSEVPADEACKAAQIYNKQSYYIDLDFDCEKTKQENIFFDIYGIATEPDICQPS